MSHVYTRTGGSMNLHSTPHLLHGLEKYTTSSCVIMTRFGFLGVRGSDNDLVIHLHLVQRASTVGNGATIPASVRALPALRNPCWARLYMTTAEGSRLGLPSG